MLFRSLQFLYSQSERALKSSLESTITLRLRVKSCANSLKAPMVILDFFRFFRTIENEKDVPNNSIIREFIGGSVFVE